ILTAPGAVAGRRGLRPTFERCQQPLHKPGLSPSALVAGLVTRVPASPAQALYERRLLGLGASLNLAPVWPRRRLWLVVGRQTGVEVRNWLVLDRVLAGWQVDDVLQFLDRVHAHRNLGGVGPHEPRSE